MAPRRGLPPKGRITILATSIVSLTIEFIAFKPFIDRLNCPGDFLLFIVLAEKLRFVFNFRLPEIFNLIEIGLPLDLFYLALFR